jgi:hypothetical protein
MKKENSENRRFSYVPKKAQMEIMGLVIIVLLISIGMVFLIKFGADQDDSKSVFTRKGLAYSTMGAIFKTTAECKNDIFGTQYPEIGKELLEDCALNKGLSATSCTYQCGGQHCCDFFDDTILELLDLTLGKQFRTYEFKAELVRSIGSDAESISTVNEDICKGKEKDTSKPFPIDTQVGTVNTILYVCS